MKAKRSCCSKFFHQSFELSDYLPFLPLITSLKGPGGLADDQTRGQQLANFHLRVSHKLDQQLDRPFSQNIKILSDGG